MARADTEERGHKKLRTIFPRAVLLFSSVRSSFSMRLLWSINWSYLIYWSGNKTCRLYSAHQQSIGCRRIHAKKVILNWRKLRVKIFARKLSCPAEFAYFAASNSRPLVPMMKLPPQTFCSTSTPLFPARMLWPSWRSKISLLLSFASASNAVVPSRMSRQFATECC